ncbi:NAD-dependent epimerase/dehydratase family protein [Actinocatenispora rupis]|uniref:NAD-dependent dehydratase n=1 Tax=Actinocatenispora rupis TaxID=519421 RepID=A0A8J3IW49_9ACTN|nr:NAD(P)-dependent oxidoreductase [Actinocatenispora rupis]GID11051.1 NAD-dependent dehydratase [Actinocatenispora rupis]
MGVQRVLVTGAAGAVGRELRPRLRRDGRVLRLMDLADQEPGDGVELVTGSVTDLAATTAACRDVDAVIHLGGLSREAAWADVLATNIDGTRTVLEAARCAGVPRVVLASSNHVAGFRTIREATGMPADSPPRPDTYYGVGKAAMEALGSLYHSRFGLDVVCVRIGFCFPRPVSVRTLAMWLSPDDCARLMEACLAAEHPGYRVVWGVSANTRRYLPLDAAEALGYRPQDDSEAYADAVRAAGDDDVPYVGGGFATAPLGEPN